MPQTTQSAGPVDPAFVRELQANISGIYFSSVAGFSPDKIEREFRKAVQDRKLMTDEEFVHNLMFLVRKREVKALRDEVKQVTLVGGLPPRGEVSSMKTLYALGAAEERDMVDDRLSRRLRSQFDPKTGPAASPLLESAERIGGPKTLDVLKEFVADAERRQSEAEKSTPDDLARISRLDQMRSDLENKTHVLSIKAEILSKPDADRAGMMAEQYLRRSGHVGIWGYKLLVDQPTPIAVDAVRDLATRRVHNLLPTGGLTDETRAQMSLDLRLRGVCLLEAMQAQLTPEEEQLLADHAAALAERSAFFRPNYDWEAVLDRD